MDQHKKSFHPSDYKYSTRMPKPKLVLKIAVSYVVSWLYFGVLIFTNVINNRNRGLLKS